MNARKFPAPIKAKARRYRDLVETSDELIFTTDRTGHWTFLNQGATERILGYRPEEMIGRPFTDFLAEEEIERDLEAFSHVLAGDEKFRYETVYQTKDGRRVTLSFNAGMLRDAAGEIVGVMGSASDITQRLRTENELRQSLKSVRSSKERLERQNEVLRKIARGAPLAGTLTQLALSIEEPGSGMIVSVLLLDPEGVRLSTAAAPHLPHSFSQAIDGVRIGPNTGSCGTAAFRGEPVIVSDIREDPLWADYRELAAAHGLRACWSQPLLASTGEVLGTLAMYYREPRSPSETELELITTAAHIASIAIEAASARDRLVHSTLHDPLTGLPNRTLFLDRLGMAMKRSQRRPDTLFAVLFLDVDHFKQVNDSLGHLVGDELLQSISERLNHCLRPVDTVARMGGDEFAVLLDYLDEEIQASQLALRIHQVLEPPHLIQGHEVTLSASIGITFSSAAYDQPEELLRDADTAMYRAKTEGRGRQAIFEAALPNEALVESSAPEVPLGFDFRSWPENQKPDPETPPMPRLAHRR